MNPSTIRAAEPRKPRRILFVITDLDVGGAEKCCMQLATRLDRRWWRPHVCCLTPPGSLGERIERAGIPVHSLGITTAWQFAPAVWRLARLMRRIRPALVQTFLFHANIVGRLAARLSGVPRVVSGIRVAERRFRYHLILENLTCRLSQRVVCVSSAVARFTRRQSHVPRSQLLVIPNGIDSEPDEADRAAIRASLGLSPDDVVVTYVGRLDAQKGVDVLLNAFAEAQPQAARLRLVIAGAGPDLESLRRLADQLGAARSVQFLGWRADVPSILHIADMFVLPSRWEGMPNVVLEAMAAGLPVIATRTEGTTELVRDGESGRLVPIDDSESLARAVLELANDPERRKRWGQRGREIAIQEFSVDQMVGRYEHLYAST